MDLEKETNEPERIMSEEMLMFLINTSEHVKRPKDMLMFIGEYFKEHIKLCAKVKTSIEKNDSKGDKDLSRYYITYDLLNLLGTACKQFIMKPRQELRIAIALSRNPNFAPNPNPDKLSEEEQDEEREKKVQFEQIKRSIIDA